MKIVRDRSEQWPPLPLRCRQNCEVLTSQWRKQCGMYSWLPCRTMGKLGEMIKIMENIASQQRKRMSFVGPHPQGNLICDGINKIRSDAFADYTALGWTKDPTNVGKNSTLHCWRWKHFKECGSAQGWNLRVLDCTEIKPEAQQTPHLDRTSQI